MNRMEVTAETVDAFFHYSLRIVVVVSLAGALAAAVAWLMGYR